MSRIEIKLGDRYRDIVTGFEGIATSSHAYLNGCIRVGITPTELSEGKPIEAVTFDIEQLVFVNKGVNQTTPVKQRDTGGPGDVPAVRAVPRR